MEKRQMHDRLRILIVAPYVPHVGRHAGGARIFHLIEQFSVSGHEVNLLALINDPEERRHLERLYPLCNRVHAFAGGAKRAGRDPLHLWPVDYRFPEVINCLNDELQCNDVVQYDFVEMIHLHPIDSPIKAVVVNHEVQHNTYGEYALLPGQSIRQRTLNVYRYVRALGVELLALKRAACVIAVTEHDRDMLSRLLPQARIEVVKHGVDVHAFGSAGVEKKPRRLLYLGYYRHRPNEEAALLLAREVFPRLREKYPDAELELAGSVLTEAVRNLDGNGVIVSGKADDLSAVYGRASIFVAPIHHGWGIRSKVLEAMASRVPVVSTSRGAEGTGAADGHEILLAETPQQFAAAVSRLWEDPALYSHVASGGRRLVEDNFDWGRLAEINLRILADVAGKRLNP